MTSVWFGIQISPVKAWRSHGKHDSRLYTPSSRFRQKKTTAELVTVLASVNDLGDQDRCLTGYDCIPVPSQTQGKTSRDLPRYIHLFFSLFPCGVKFSEWWTLTLARLMCSRENYSNFPLKRTGWIRSEVTYSLPVWVPPSIMGEIPCVWWETVTPAGLSEDKMLAWTGEVNVNNVRQAGPGAAFTERGNSRNNCFVQFALADKQPYYQMASEVKSCKYIIIAVFKFKPSRFCYFWNINNCEFNVVAKRRFFVCAVKTTLGKLKRLCVSVTGGSRALAFHFTSSIRLFILPAS